MRIVVFTANYPPLINPRAFRIKKFVESNTEFRDILVITSPVKSYIEKDARIVRCGLRMNSNQEFKNSIKRYAIIRFLHKLLWPDDKLSHQIIYLLKYLFKYRKKDDLIITVSNPFSSHIIGLVLNKIWKHQWKADIGDTYFGNQHHSFLSKFLERIVLQTADQIIVNSDSLKNHFLLNYKLTADKFSVTSNGIQFDVTKIKKTPSNHIRLSYIGNTYAGVREAIDELNMLIELAKNHPELKIKIQLFGNQFYKIDDLAKRYPELIQIAFCKNEEEVIQAYSNTDILINFANKNNPGLPSKLEEYVASGLPVINFIYSEEDASFNYLLFRSNHVFVCRIDHSDMNKLNEFILSQTK